MKNISAHSLVARPAVAALTVVVCVPMSRRYRPDDAEMGGQVLFSGGGLRLADAGFGSSFGAAVAA